MKSMDDMTDPQAESAETLVRHFFAAAPLAFSEVAQAPGYRSQVTLHQAGATGLEAVAPDRITSWCWAVWRFETARLCGEVRFGDREWGLTVAAAPPGTAIDFELWEWSQLDGSSGGVRSGEGLFCDTRERLERGLRRYAGALQYLGDRIEAQRPADLELLRQDRSQRKDAWLANLRAHAHARAGAQADEAFRAGDFSRVLKLLAPFDAILTPAERTKVAIARRKSKAGPG